MRTHPVDEMIEALAGFDGSGLDDASRIDLVGALERLKGAAAGAQARVTAAFAAAQETSVRTRAEQRVARRSVGAQVGLARRVSPSAGDRCVSLARLLVDEMPLLHAALSSGATSEHAASEVVTATSGVEPRVRAEVDRRLGPDLDRLSARQLGAAARTVVAELDAAAVVARNERAVAARRVSLRPAPDDMAYLSVLGPLREIVGAYAALRSHAAGVVSGHDPDGELPEGRSRDAVMTDTALRWLSGRRLGEAQAVAVQLVMTDRSLTGLGDPGRPVDEPARLVGHGPVAAPTARAWLRRHPEAPQDVQAWVRRMFTAPDGRDLVALESGSRLFPAKLREFLVLRDDTCRTRFCDAPVAHADHVVPHVRGGPTSAGNGQGDCARCNLTKEAPGWDVRVLDTGLAHSGSPHRTMTTTPTGHTYDSTAPPVLGTGWRPPGPPGDPWDEVDWADIERDHPDWFGTALPAA